MMLFRNNLSVSVCFCARLSASSTHLIDLIVTTCMWISLHTNTPTQCSLFNLFINVQPRLKDVSDGCVNWSLITVLHEAHKKKKKLIFFKAAFWNSQEIIGGASSLSLSLSPLICHIRIRITKMIYFRKWIKELVVQRASPMTCRPSRLLIFQNFSNILYYNVQRTNLWQSPVLD